MTCSRCLTGLMVIEPWYDTGGNRGVDWVCKLCSHRQFIRAESGYTAERVYTLGKQTRWSTWRERA